MSDQDGPEIPRLSAADSLPPADIACPLSNSRLYLDARSSAARSSPSPVANSRPCHVLFAGTGEDRGGRGSSKSARAGRTGGRARPPQYSRSVSSAGVSRVGNVQRGRDSQQRHGFCQLRVSRLRGYNLAFVSVYQAGVEETRRLETPIHHE